MNLLFNSFGFVFLYMPVTVAIYWLAGRFFHTPETRMRFRRDWLLALSFLYYASFGMYNFSLLCVSLGVTLLLSKLMKGRKSLLIAGIVFHLAFLSLFKYSGAAFGLRLLFPLGISFYTFTQISWLVDLYHGEVGEYRITDYLLYATFYPKLLQGPIVTYRDMKAEFDKMADAVFSEDAFSGAVILFVIGLFKKAVLADTLGLAVTYGYEHLTSLTWLDGWLAAVFYILELFFDFSGYCDMGAAVCRMMGMDLPVNFDKPFHQPDNISFWRSWHSSLNRFFVKYVYLPLGGSRAGSMRTYMNIFIVFLLSGLWHGSTRSFVLWGILHGALCVLTRFVKRHMPSGTMTDMAGQQDGRDVLPQEGGAAVSGPLSGRVLHRAGAVMITFWYAFTSVYLSAPDYPSASALVRVLLSRPVLRITQAFAMTLEADELWYLVKLTPFAGMRYSRYICMFIFLFAGLALIWKAPTSREIAQRLPQRRLTGAIAAVLFVWAVVSLGEVSIFLYFQF